MSVRQSLLAILDLGPSYGYRLSSEFEQRTGGTWPLNIGQVYSTLERLERDGLVRDIGVDDDGHRMFELTDAGRAEARAWLGSPTIRTGAERNELALKLAIAATLPGFDLRDVIQVQRAATMRHLQDLTATKAAGAADGDLAWSLVVDAHIFQAEAEIRWLDHTEGRLARLAAGPSTASGVEMPRPVAAKETAR